MSGFQSAQEWIDGLKTLCGIPTSDVGLEWQGQSFCFVPMSADSPHPGSLSIYVWIGPRSLVTSVDAVCQLMWLQLQTVGPVPPVLGFEPDSGQLVIAQCIEWQEIKPEQALVLMSFLGDLASEARDVLSGTKKSSPAGDVARKSMGDSALRRGLPRGCLVQPLRA
jgi:hypothetical protein